MNADECPRESCRRKVPIDRFACAHHWRVLPREVRDRVWARWDGRLDVPYDELVAEANAAWDAGGYR